MQKLIYCAVVLVAGLGGMQSSYAQLPNVSFRHLDYRHGLPEYTASSQLLQDHLDRIWLASNQGLYMYDGYEITTFTPDLVDTTTLAESIIQALMLDEHNRIWIGTRNMGICLYNPETGHFSRYLPIAQGGTLPSARIWHFTKGEDGYVWIATNPGLVRCDPDSMTFEHYIFSIKDWTNPADIDFVNTLRTIVEDPNDSDLLWICTRAGLVSFDKRTGEARFHEMPFSSRNEGFDSRNYLLTDVVFTDSANAWFTSWEGGLLHYNTGTEEWERFQEERIGDEPVVGHNLDIKDDDELWLCSNNGMGIFNMRNHTFSYFPTTSERSDGLKASHRYAHHIFTRDSTLIVMGSLGMSISTDYPVSGEAGTTSVPLISRLMVNNQPVIAERSPVYLSDLKLEEDERDLNFTVAWPVFNNPERALYRFRLEGYNDSWVYNRQSRTVQYTNLRPGEYTFYYEGSKDGQTWVAGLTTPTIKIQRPLWNHPAVIAGLGVILVGGIGGFYSQRIRHIRKEEELKRTFSQKLADNEMRALRAQMNPHFMFNSLNSIKNYILKEDTEAASRYLTKFSQLMRAILRNSEKDLITLEDELNALRLYIEIEARRFRDSFTYDFDVDPEIDLRHVYVPPLLIQPYVENAIWHGLMLKKGPRVLRISVHRNGGSLQIEVTDNGIGRAASAEMQKKRQYPKESFGMKITNDRITLIKDTLNIDADVEVTDLFADDGMAAGTEVKLRIPVISEDYDIPAGTKI